MPPHLAVLHVPGRQHHGPSVLDKHVRRHVERRRQHERLVEPECVGTGIERPAEIGRLGGAQPQVPLANAAGSIAEPLEQRRHRHAARFDQRGRITVEHARLEPRAPRVAPGEQTVPRGRADRRGRMRIGEAHALAGQPIDVRRGNLRLAVVNARIAVAQVVGQDHQHVRPRRALRSRSRRFHQPRTGDQRQRDNEGRGTTA